MTRNAAFRVVYPSGQPMGWLQKAVALVVLCAVVVLGFFFLTMALVAGAILAAVILLRLWWLKRKLRSAAISGTYEGDYVVIEQAREDEPPRDRREP